MNTRITTTYGKSKICTSYISEKGEVVVVVPGYSETIAHTKKIIDALGELGINSFTFSPPRKYHASADEDPIIRQGGCCSK